MPKADLEFRELKKSLEARGLFSKTRGFYFGLFLRYVFLLSASVALIAVLQNSYWQIVNVFLFSFALVQLSFIGHDMAHHQVFSSSAARTLFNRLWWGLVLGAAYEWWASKHNRHHANPNQLGKDPDIDQLFVFSPKQSESSGKIFRMLARYQHLYFFPLLLLAQISIIRGTIKHFSSRDKDCRTFADIGLQALHYILLYFVIFYSLGFLYGALFVASYSLIVGAYLGLTFAPNHKGMPIVGENAMLPHVQQIITARNIKLNFFTDFLYGGLNYQIEHHLFPAMPRKNLKKARPLVMDFCQKSGLPYHETTIFGSFAEIYRGLKAAC